MTKQTNGNNWNGMNTDKIKRWGKRALTTTAILGTLAAGTLGYNNLNTKIDNLSNQNAAQTTQVSDRDAHQTKIDSLEQVTSTYEAQIDSLQNRSDLLEQRIDANNFVIDLYHGNEPTLQDTSLEASVDTLAAPDTTTQDTTQTPSTAQDSTTQRLGLHLHPDDPHSILYNTDKDAEHTVDAGPAFQDGRTFSPAGDPFTYTIQNVNGDVDLIAEQENTGKTTPTFSLDNNASWLQQPKAKAAVKHYLSQDQPDMTAGEALQHDMENRDRGQQTMTAAEALQYDMENQDRGQQTMTAAEAFAYDVDNQENQQRTTSELPSAPADSLDQTLQATTEDPQYTTGTDRSIEVGPTFNTQLGAGINASYDLGKTEIGTTFYPGTTDNFNETSLSEIEGPGRLSGLYGATENVESADITTKGGTLNLSQRLFETNGLETNLSIGAGLEYQSMTGTSSQNLLEATSPDRIQEQEGLYTNQELNTSQIDRDNIRSLVRLGLEQELGKNLELNGGLTLTPGKDITGQHTSPGVDLGLVYKF